MIRWLRRRRKVVPPQETEGIKEAQQALGEARAATIGEWQKAGQAQALGASFRDLRRENRFGLRIAAAYKEFR